MSVLISGVEHALRLRFRHARALAAALVLLAAAPAFAWSDPGHLVIATVARARLSLHGDPRNAIALKAADTLLAGDPDPLTEPDFASRSLWADRYRDSDRDGTRERYEGTRRWHFVDIQVADRAPQLACAENKWPRPASAGPAEDCIVNKIEQFVAELQDPATPVAEKRLALKYLLHLVGDLHQPLHAADNHDRGGNAVDVAWGHPAETGNLHGYWDRQVVARLDRNWHRLARRLGRTITPADEQAFSRGTPAQWARESFRQAADVAYRLPAGRQLLDEQGREAVVLDAGYEQRALPVAARQLAKAGVRLAEVLRRALGTPR